MSTIRCCICLFSLVVAVSSAHAGFERFTGEVTWKYSASTYCPVREADSNVELLISQDKESKQVTAFMVDEFLTIKRFTGKERSILTDDTGKETVKLSLKQPAGELSAGMTRQAPAPGKDCEWEEAAIKLTRADAGDAEKSFRTAEKRYPAEVEARKAAELLERKQYTHAVTAGMRALDLDPLNARAYSVVAGAHMELRQLDKAEKVITSGRKQRTDKLWQALFNDLDRRLEYYRSEKKFTGCPSTGTSTSEEALEQYLTLLGDYNRHDEYSHRTANCYLEQFSSAIAYRLPGEGIDWPELALLLIGAKVMDTQEKQYWFDIMPSMTLEQKEKLYDMLYLERN